MVQEPEPTLLTNHGVRPFSRPAFKTKTLIMIAIFIILAVHAQLIMTNSLSKYGQAKLSFAEGTVLPEDLDVFDLPPGFKEPSHMSSLDPNILISIGHEEIDAVHSRGLIHLGAWMFITDADGLVLLLQRGPQLVTCPNTWSLTGEHTARGEEPIETVKRGITEELGDDLLDDVVSIQNMTAYPQYFLIDWGTTEYGKRVDRQLTYIWHVQLGKKHKDLHLGLDDEVANHKWVDLETFKEQLEENIGGTKEIFCIPEELKYYADMVKLSNHTLDR
mmetsp:Transcript_14544/g.19899  ORF Transcript_14544/g.19899 Transcript_14544/m.19899 type:complete len:275 (-) Transcript_14544:141-965(-)